MYSYHKNNRVMVSTSSPYSTTRGTWKIAKKKSKMGAPENFHLGKEELRCFFMFSWGGSRVLDHFGRDLYPLFWP